VLYRWDTFAKTIVIPYLQNYKCDELWKEVRKGNKQAFETLYNKTIIPLSDQALRILKDEHLVKDILQDLFVNVYFRREEIGEEVNITGYLHNALKYKVASVLRSRVNAHNRSLPIEEANEYLYIRSDEIEKKEMRVELENNIQTLPQKCREAFILNYVNEFSYKEIASEMNISLKTVEKHISKALRVLRNGRWTN